MFIACHTFNVLELHYDVICDLAEIQFAFELTNAKVPEIQNYNFFLTMFKDSKFTILDNLMNYRIHFFESVMGMLWRVIERLKI